MEQQARGTLLNRGLGLGILLVVALLGVGTRTQEQTRPARIVTPQGVHILQNKSFDDSDEARREILDLYQDLRLTDVLDGMDLIGLQDIGLMDNRIRPLWRDADKFTHRFVGFAITVRHVPTDVRVGQNSFPTLEGFQKFKSEQYGRAPDAWTKAARPGDVVVIDAGGGQGNRLHRLEQQPRLGREGGHRCGDQCGRARHR
jgi:hypothetical protein